MADIAAIFGWTPDVMEPMDLNELAEWRDLAYKRSGAETK